MFSIRRSVAVALTAAALTTGVVQAQSASAQVTSSRAAIVCERGRVRAYAPAAAQTKSNRANGTLQTYAELLRWNPSAQQWQSVANSGWWASASTDSSGRMVGQWFGSRGPGAMFYPFTVASGYYYMVRTSIYDSADRSTVTLYNVADVQSSVSNSAGNYCQA